MYVSVYTCTHVWEPSEVRRGQQISLARVTGGCELPSVDAGNWGAELGSSEGAASVLKQSAISPALGLGNLDAAKCALCTILNGFYIPTISKVYDLTPSAVTSNEIVYSYLKML